MAKAKSQIQKFREAARAVGAHDSEERFDATLKKIAQPLAKVCPECGHVFQGNGWDGSYFHTTRIAAKRAYAEAGIDRPREQISMTEVHDCFSITELVTMEDLFLSDEGRAVRDVLEGEFDASGRVPCQIDGGLKCFGHPVGASGIRMLYEIYLQLNGRAAARQLADPSVGLIHNLGGQPSQNVCSVSIIGREGV